MGRALIASVSVALLALVPGGVSAHATPITYTPEAGSTVLEAPSSVGIYFSERIEPEASGIKIFAPDGTEVHEGKASLDITDPRIFSIGMEGRGEGVYTATWQVVSVDDGHFTRGSFSFLVDATGRVFEGPAEGATQVTYVTKVGEAWANLLGLLGESLLIGVLVMYACVVCPLIQRRTELTPIRANLERGALYAVVLGGVLMCAGGLMSLVRKVSELAALRQESFGDALTVYVQSTVGTYLCLKVGAAIIFVLLYMLLRKRLVGEGQVVWSYIPLGALIGLIIFAQSKVSHASASFFYPNLSVAVTALHVFFKELLVGGVALLAALVAYLARIQARGGVQRAMVLYDKLAAIAIILAGTSGAYITWLHLKRVESLAVTEWGERFIALAFFGLLLGGFRFLHQFVLGPRVSRSGGVLGVVRVTLLVEMAVGVGMLFYSGYISITTPPFVVEQYAYSAQVVDDGVALTLGVHPYETGMFRIAAYAYGETTPVPLSGVVIAISNPERGIEANVVSAERRTSHSFVFPESSLSPVGQWDIHVTAMQEGKYDSNAVFEIAYPEDVAATRFSDDVRTYDAFARTVIMVGVGILLYGVVSFAYAHYRMKTLAGMAQDTVGRVAETVPYGIIAVIVSALIVLTFLGLDARVLSSDFERACVRDGFSWRQALPAREFEVVGKNAVMGCWVHDGHYHFADYDEYQQHYLSF